MKKLNLFAILGAIAFAAVTTASQALADSVPQVVTVVRVNGTARYSTDSKTWQSLKKGDVLKAGCVIQTAPKSIVDIQLGERDAATAAQGMSANPNSTLYSPEEAKANIVRIFENSALGVDKLILEKTGQDEVAETQLDLRAGQIMGNVKKLSATSKYEVKIPNGVAGIRGTVFMISSSGVVNVLSGSVVIAVVGSDGTVVTRVVTARMSYDPTNNTVTPISPPVLTMLQQVYVELHGPPNTPGTGPIHTPTGPIIYVSPN